MAPPRFGMVAGEASGDLLAGLLLDGMRRRWPGAWYKLLTRPWYAVLPSGRITKASGVRVALNRFTS